ncbi:MAG: CPBP family intramembrane metalloprotease [Bacteroidales bacterium]|nr:CPBP family intramembrane metalloprotease [Bacteroidales bacterium]
MDEFKKNLKESTGFRVFIYLMALLVCTLVGGAVTLFLAVGNNIDLLKLGQGISSALMFIAPPLILYAFTRKQPMREIGFRKPNSAWMLLIGVALMFVSLPLTNLFGDWNEKMNFGSAFESLEALLKQMEDAASELTDRMLQVDTIWGLLVNLLVIALIPAIGEELTFRGMLQQALHRGCKNAHVAVFLSAFIFSFIHFQFYGFLPRMFLGLILGYLFYYSGSLWTSILMHFVNNGAAVVVAYLEHKGLTDVDYEHFGATSNVWLLLLSLVVTVGLIVLCNKIKTKYGRKQ